MRMMTPAASSGGCPFPRLPRKTGRRGGRQGRGASGRRIRQRVLRLGDGSSQSKDSPGGGGRHRRVRVHVCVRTHECVHVCAHVCLCVHCVCVHACVCACMCVRVCAHVRVRTHECVRACLCVCGRSAPAARERTDAFPSPFPHGRAPLPGPVHIQHPCGAGCLHRERLCCGGRSPGRGLRAADQSATPAGLQPTLSTDPIGAAPSARPG